MKQPYCCQYSLAKRIWLPAVLVICCCQFIRAETLTGITNPKKTNDIWVSDMAQVLSVATEKQLNAISTDLERRTTAEIAMVTVRRTDGSNPAEFADKLFNRWAIGKKGKNNGVLVLVMTESPRIMIKRGLGIERILTDEKIQEIMDKQIVPHFKKDDYNGAVLDAVRAMAQEISKGQPKPASPRKEQ